VKKFIVHRFDSLAKVVVSPVFQGFVDVFQNVLDQSGGTLSLFGDRSADDAGRVNVFCGPEIRRWVDVC
jgi:hypothetical protein